MPTLLPLHYIAMRPMQRALPLCLWELVFISGQCAMVIMDVGRKPMDASTIFNIGSNSGMSSRCLGMMCVMAILMVMFLRPFL